MPSAERSDSTQPLDTDTRPLDRALSGSGERDEDPTLLESAYRAPAPPPSTERYEARSVLGEGGMGEVRLVWDRVVLREVAMKVLLPARAKSPRARERFLREAHVQGFLDHPSVVPVHDVGTLPTGEPYFTMKRVRGATLQSLLDGWRAKDARITSRFGQRRMLTAFAQACIAVHYAHVRGVVHRDLKPENVMLGDFGEVYVLDWGLARVVGTQMHRMPAGLLSPITRGDGSEVLGTLGFMAPEQIETPEDVDQSADVYALGAILFELLTLERLHVGRSVRELILSTRDGADARCSVRAPRAAVPAELEALCVRATHRDPLKRPAARELHETLESVLDGDRERERRRVRSDLHLRAAKERWKRAMEKSPRSDADEREAIRGLASALATDPRNDEALTSLLDVLSQPVDRVPDEAVVTMQDEEERQRRVAAGALRWGRLSWLAYVPLVAWLGVRDRFAFLALISAIVLAAVLNLLVERHPRPRPWMRTSVAVMAMLTMMPIATLFSPIVLLPVLLAASMPAFIVHLDRVGRVVTTAAACVAGVTPLLLDSLGVLPPSLTFRDGAMVILPNMTELPEVPTRIALTLFAVTPLLTGALLMLRVRGELDAARRRVHVHLWRLRQLMPGAGVAGERTESAAARRQHTSSD